MLVLALVLISVALGSLLAGAGAAGSPLWPWRGQENVLSFPPPQAGRATWSPARTPQDDPASHPPGF